MKTTTFESGNESVYFENGPTSHLSFSSYKQNETAQKNLHDLLLTRDLPCLALNHALQSRDYWCCRLSVYSFIPFLAYRNESV